MTSWYLAGMHKHLRVLLVGFTFLASLFAFAGLAGAQGNGSTTYVGPDTGPKPEVLSTTAVNPTGGVSAAQTAAPNAQALAFTGGDSLPLLIAGGSVILIGTGLLVVRRRMAQA